MTDKENDAKRIKEMKEEVQAVFDKHCNHTKVAWAVTWSTEDGDMIEVISNIPVNVVKDLFRGFLSVAPNTGILIGDPDTGGLKDE